jgi:D-amino-acid oxidase
MSAQGKVIVLGAGVIGLTTALLLKHRGYNVVVVAKATPDPRYIDADPYYASREAGAHWSSFAEPNDFKLQEIETVTFKTFMELSKFPETGIMRVTSVNYLRKPEDLEHVWYRNLVPNYKVLNSNDVVPGASSGYSFTTGLLPSFYTFSHN